MVDGGGIVMRRPIMVTLFLALASVSAVAQQAPPPPPVAAPLIPPAGVIEGAVGLATFVDDANIDFAYFGGSCRSYLSRRVAIGPEFIYMDGPSGSHQRHLTGNVSVDLRSDVRQGSYRLRVVPYVIAAAGYQRMTDHVGTGMYTSSEGSVSGGIGARVALGERFFVAPEFRLGWEPHYRFGATIGARF
jgi:hypothetical protein